MNINTIKNIKKKIFQDLLLSYIYQLINKKVFRTFVKKDNRAENYI